MCIRDSHSLVELFWATNDERFLEMAERVADTIIVNLYDNGLYVREPGALYARTGNLTPLAMLDLAAAKRGIKLAKNAVFPRYVYLRAPHGPLPWVNTSDKIWDQELILCRMKSNNSCASGGIPTYKPTPSRPPRL